MHVRKLILMAAMVALAACGGRDDTTPPDSGSGCTGACSSDSGTPDSGTPDSGTPDAGQSCNAFIANASRPVVAPTTDPDAGTVMTIAELRYGRLSDGSFIPFHTHALIQNATVQAVDFVSSDGGSEGFWIVDGSDAGFYVYKRSSDTVAANPQAGDVVDVDAFFNTQPKYYSPDGYRYTLANNYYGSGNANNRPLIITSLQTGTTPPTVNLDANCAMDAKQGTTKLYQDSQPHAGQRIHINGPLTITDAHPVALARVTELVDGGAQITGYNGFEISGGILVNDGNTFSRDGGFGAPDACDWAVLADGGYTVTFPNGVSGIWDSYTMHPCIDDGAGGCKTSGDNGYVPNPTALTSDAGNPQYTFALFPEGCADLAGDAGSGVTP